MQTFAREDAQDVETYHNLSGLGHLIGEYAAIRIRVKRERTCFRDKRGFRVEWVPLVQPYQCTVKIGKVGTSTSGLRQ